MAKKTDEIIIENAENMTEEELKKAIANERRRRTREANKLKKEQESKQLQEVEDMKENNTTNNSNNIDIDAILSTPKYKKKALSFYQDKSVSEALTARAKASDKKNSEALNLILNGIIDLENMTCKIDIDEKKEEKIANTFKVDERILNVLNKEADSRNMSVNEYLNKVLKVVLNLN